MRKLLKRWLGRWRQWRNRRLSAAEVWQQGVAFELDFWQAWLATGGGAWPDDYQARLDSQQPLQSELAALLPPGTAPVRVLDVGAGPLTCLGKQVPGRQLELHACDALGAHYATLVFPPGQPVVRTVACDSERLLEQYAADSFDLVHARNTLDHSYAPLQAIRAMVQVTRPGGYVVLDHAANEAENEGYAGFHQWNFLVRGGSLWLGNSRGETDVLQALRGQAVVRELPADGAQRVRVVLQKLSGELAERSKAPDSKSGFG